SSRIDGKDLSGGLRSSHRGCGFVGGGGGIAKRCILGVLNQIQLRLCAAGEIIIRSLKWGAEMIPKDIEQRCADATLNCPLARRVDNHEHTEIYLPRLPGRGRRSQRGSGKDFYLTCDIFGNRGVFDRSSCRFFNGVLNLIKRIS